MGARLFAPVVALLCVLSIAANSGQVVKKVEVRDGPTPFISFVDTRVGDVASFEFARFRI